MKRSNLNIELMDLHDNSKVALASMTTPNSKSTGCAIGGVVLCLMIGLTWYKSTRPSTAREIAVRYKVPPERVTVQPIPHGCNFWDAPVGNKHCRYEKHLAVYSKIGEQIMKDGLPTECPGCAAWMVEESWERVDE